MAEGRMLKKVICESPRLAALKNDTHRLIYTWLIPHLDIEGRHFADPRIIKSHVAPILDHITNKIITSALNDMAVNNLIILYEVDGKKCLELCNFKKHQNLRESREKKSDIPSPTPGALQEPSRITPKQGNIREGNIREAKLNAREAGPKHLPVDNSEDDPPLPPYNPEEDQKEAFVNEPKKPSSNTHGERWTKKQGDELEALMADVKDRWGSRYYQRLYVTVQANFNRCNPDAMLYCLKNLIRLKLSGQDISLPGQWLDAALNGNGKTAGENGKFEAAQYDREAQERKADIGMPQSVGAILRQVSARAGP